MTGKFKFTQVQSCDCSSNCLINLVSILNLDFLLVFMIVVNRTKRWTMGKLKADMLNKAACWNLNWRYA